MRLLSAKRHLAPPAPGTFPKNFTHHNPLVLLLSFVVPPIVFPPLLLIIFIDESVRLGLCERATVTSRTNLWPDHLLSAFL